MGIANEYFDFIINQIEHAIKAPPMFGCGKGGKDQQTVRELVVMFNEQIVSYCFLACKVLPGDWEKEVTLHKFWSYYNKKLQRGNNLASIHYTSEDYETRIKDFQNYVEVFKEWRETVKQFEEN